jgi:hypothetical protein
VPVLFRARIPRELEVMEETLPRSPRRPRPPALEDAAPRDEEERQGEIALRDEEESTDDDRPPMVLVVALPSDGSAPDLVLDPDLHGAAAPPPDPAPEPAPSVRRDDSLVAPAPAAVCPEREFKTRRG